MPLSPPAPRTLKHVRRVNYQGFERDDGLWDIEGELHDSKAYDATSFRDPTKQHLAGGSMARGWRQSIQKHLGGVASCTHLRELLFNLATAAFQSVPAVFSSSHPDEPPRHLGQCTGWDFNGQGVKDFSPQFSGRAPQAAKLAEQATATDSTAEISAK